jgi:hypothetical protein
VKRIKQGFNPVIVAIDVLMLIGSSKSVLEQVAPRPVGV